MSYITNISLKKNELHKKKNITSCVLQETNTEVELRLQKVYYRVNLCEKKMKRIRTGQGNSWTMIPTWPKLRHMNEKLHSQDC